MKIKLITRIDHIDFIKKMDEWYLSTKCKKNWSKTIPTKLSYFVYWLTKTSIKNIEINSTIFAGSYYNAIDEFNEYIANAKKSKFNEGYPFSVFIRDNEVYVGQFMDYGSITAKFSIDHQYSPREFITYFRKNLVFLADDGMEYDKNNMFFRDSIKKEIKQLFVDI